MSKSVFRNGGSIPIIGLTLFALSAPAQAASQITSFDVPGSVGTHPYGINQGGTIVGRYVDKSGNTNGFMRTSDGTISTIFADASQVFGIDKEGEVVGDIGDGDLEYGILQGKNGKCCVQVAYPSAATGTIATATIHGLVVGMYGDNTGAYHGFSFETPGEGEYESFDPPGSINTIVGDVSTAGIVGRFTDSSNAQHGFVIPGAGGTVVFDPPGSVKTNAQSINVGGTITGGYYDSTNAYHAYVRAPNGMITTFDVTGDANGTFANSINDKGEIAGYYGDASGQFHGFERSVSGKITTFDPKGSVDTKVECISNTGVITGFYTDAGGAVHGFVRSR